MESMFNVSTLYGQFYYDLFYFLAIVFAGVFFLIDGHRRRYPVHQSALIFGCAVIFLIIGSKLFTYTPEEWKGIFSSFSFPHTQRKTILGGILGGIFGVWLSKKFLRISYPILDSFAVSFPVTMAIQRIGCLMAGCCHGTITDLAWAIRYSEHSIPYHHQLGQGLINPDYLYSLPIHPNQLYQVILCLGVALITWKLRNRLVKTGDLLYTSLTLYLAVRFIIEFWRDDETNGIAGEAWMGLKLVQWILLAAIGLILTLVYIRERKKYSTMPLEISNNFSLGLLISLCLGVIGLKNWLTDTEFLFALFVLLPVISIYILELINRLAYGYRSKLINSLAILLVIFYINVLQAQKTYRQIGQSGNYRNNYKEVGIGYGNYRYSHYVKEPIPSYGCYSNYIPNPPIESHVSNALGVRAGQLHTFTEYRKLYYGAELSFGNNSFRDTLGKVRSFQTVDIAPRAEFKTRWIGLGLGFRTGIGAKPEKNLDNILYTFDEGTEGYLIPTFSFTFGPYDILYVGSRINESFPFHSAHRSDYSFGNPTYQVIVGSGLGFANGTGIELGADLESNTYVSLKAFIKNRYGIQGMFMNQSNEYTNQYFQISLAYRFN